MTDSRNPPTCDKVVALLSSGPLTALEISQKLKCSLNQTMERLHLCWWTIIPVAGDWQGWKYAQRPILNAKGKPIKQVGEYLDVGITKQSSRMPLSSYAGEGYGKQRHGY